MEPNVRRIYGSGLNGFKQIAPISDGVQSAFGKGNAAICCNPTYIPLDVKDENKAVGISAALNHTLFLVGDKVYCAGTAFNSKFGNKRQTIQDTYYQIAIDPALEIAAGKTYALYLTNKFKIVLQTKGIDAFKEFGMNVECIRASDSYPGIIDKTGKIWLFKKASDKGSDNPLIEGPVIKCETIQKWKDLALGEKYIFAITENGQLFQGEYPNNANTFRMVQVASMVGKLVERVFGRFEHYAALTNEGEVYMFGKNDRGQFGDNTQNDSFDNFKKIPFFNKMRIKSISCGGKHTLFVTNEGTLYACGANGNAQLLLGKMSDGYNTPIKVDLKGKVDFVEAGTKCSFACATGKSIGGAGQVSAVSAPLHLYELIREQKAEIEKLKGEAISQNLSDYMVDPSDFEIKKEIACGTYGVVMLVQNKTTGEPVAQKKFTKDSTDGNKFIKEIENLILAKHPLVVEVIGYNYQTQNTDASIFTEYAPNGNLMELINKNPPYWNNTRKTIIALEIAIAMDYIHALDILHRDLKPQNVLITDNLDAKITDFGESTGDLSKTQTKGIGTYYYMSPEMANEEKYDKSTDVYSYGIILYQIVFGTLPKINNKNRMDGTRPPIPSCTQFAKELIESCWDQNPNHRPSFSHILEMFKHYDYGLFQDTDPYYLKDKVKLIELISPAKPSE